MGLLQKLKSTLGLGGSRSPPRHDQRGEVDVRVEHEPAAETESAVKGTDDSWESPPTEDESVAEEQATADDEAGAEEASAAEDEPTGAEPAGADVSVDELSGIGAAYAERLGNAGVDSVADLAGADAESLAEESGIAQGRIESWIEQAAEY